MAKGGTGALSVDGKEVAKKAIPHTVPAIFTFDESFDVGVDTRTGVDDKDYQPPFRFTGKLGKLTIKLAEPKTDCCGRRTSLEKQIQDVRNAASERRSSRGARNHVTGARQTLKSCANHYRRSACAGSHSLQLRW